MFGDTRGSIASSTTVLIAVTAVALLALVVFTGASEEAGVTADSTNPTAPRGIHLSVTEDASTTMTVTWFTDSEQAPDTIAQYGPSCAALTDEATRQEVEGTAKPLTIPDSTFVHEATMTGFSPGETFAYRVGSADGGFSDCYTTHTAPEDGPVDVVLYGDQGLSSAAQAVHDRIAESNPDLVLIAGDLSYAEGDADEWDEWFAMNQDIFAETPMMSAPGNHETEAQTDPSTLPYEERLAQPGEEIYYSFDYSNIHVLVLHSTLADAKLQGVYQDMIAFAEEDLRQAQQAKADGEIDHVFVLQHHPLFSSTQRTSRYFEPEHTTLEEQWFHRYDVNMLLAGHNHNYERSYPVAYQTPTDTSEGPYEDPVGWIQVTSGGGGKGKYELRHPANRLPYSATAKFVHHHTELAVDGERVDVQAVQARFPAGEIVDEFTLIDTDERVPLPAPAGQPSQAVGEVAG